MISSERAVVNILYSGRLTLLVAKRQDSKTHKLCARRTKSILFSVKSPITRSIWERVASIANMCLNRLATSIDTTKWWHEKVHFSYPKTKRSWEQQNWTAYLSAILVPRSPVVREICCCTWNNITYFLTYPWMSSTHQCIIYFTTLDQVAINVCVMAAPCRHACLVEMNPGLWSFCIVSALNRTWYPTRYMWRSVGLQLSRLSKQRHYPYKT